MSHESECPTPNCNNWREDWGYDSEPRCHCDGQWHSCICTLLRAAYKRGREDAAKAIHACVYHPQEEMAGRLMTIKMAIDTARGEVTDDDCTFEDCNRLRDTRGVSSSGEQSDSGNGGEQA